MASFITDFVYYEEADALKWPVRTAAISFIILYFTVFYHTSVWINLLAFSLVMYAITAGANMWATYNRCQKVDVGKELKTSVGATSVFVVYFAAAVVLSYMPPIGIVRVLKMVVNSFIGTFIVALIYWQAMKIGGIPILKSTCDN